LKEKIKSFLDTHFNSDVVLEKPRQKEHGHFSTPIAFSLAKTLRKSPMIIADDISKELSVNPMFKSVEAIKGYINFKLNDDFLDEYAQWALNHEKAFGRSNKKGKILLEFVSANPTGPLHIGHARGAIYGDILLRLGRHLGYDITAEYYVNDAGNQIDLLGISLRLAGLEHSLKQDNIQWPEEFYRGEYIIELAQKAYKHFGDDIFLDKKRIKELALWGKDQMMSLVRQNLADAGIIFDTFVNESSLYEDWERVLNKLKLKNGVYTKENKLWLKSTEYGDELDRVVVRDDGRATYLAGDIIYHNQKFERNYDTFINIWGADHHGYIKRVKASLEFLDQDSSKLEILLSQMVALLKDGKPYKMSKRAGNFILMSDVVKEIGADALRFVFASKKSDTMLDFDVADLKKQDSSNPVFYVNYAHARINTLIEKSTYEINDINKIKLSNLDEDSRDLLFNALLLPEIIEDAFTSRQVQKLAEYLKTLAGSVHKFYGEHKIIGTKNEKQYLKLLLVVALSIRQGLSLMGIKAQYKM
jgi:arginyl-tRNA synthetase